MPTIIINKENLFLPPAWCYSLTFKLQEELLFIWTMKCLILHFCQLCKVAIGYLILVYSYLISISALFVFGWNFKSTDIDISLVSLFMKSLRTNQFSIDAKNCYWTTTRHAQKRKMHVKRSDTVIQSSLS